MYTVRKPVNRCPLQAAYVGATVSTFLLLVSAEGARAHIDVQPRLVEQGKVVQLRVELPQLRAGPAPEQLEVEGVGVEGLSTRLQGTRGPETVWTVRVRATGPPGPVLLILRAVFADGESVEVDDTLTIVPAEEPSSFPWAIAAGGTLLALAVAVSSLALARRRRA